MKVSIGNISNEKKILDQRQQLREIYATMLTAYTWQLVYSTIDLCDPRKTISLALLLKHRVRKYEIRNAMMQGVKCVLVELIYSALLSALAL